MIKMYHFLLRSRKFQNWDDRDSFVNSKLNELSKFINYEPGPQTD